MDHLNPDETVVKQGVFIYADDVECDLRIVRIPVQYGSGDWQDPPEVRNDQVRETFDVQFGSTTQRGVFTAGSGGFPSLEAATAAACAAPGMGPSTRWTDSNP